ncbi:hypothetical protein HM1_0546 [Heliomicrobium modesticaldum Ice1]|uniref:Uncharacterized protein n=1 Tax=Heliobacterium modesticaldum (strain ATCC 51547 / Ice1) TaxID=498761 RepID=B0TG03_HELMI|nr:hypothetical protein [Heliomicrobium modesticaldum]ABZ83160.1 hypothetical protein HM1_0546 [Heliomicrobium modesticaldum Ice1]
MSETMEKCPIYAHLESRYAPDIDFIMNRYGVPDWQAICNEVCPNVLGYYEGTADGRCAIRLRMLRIED